MVVTTRNAQDGGRKPDHASQTRQNRPTTAASNQTKANEKQSQYLHAVYDTLAESGQVALASRATGLSEPWIRRWMYREKRNRKGGKHRYSKDSDGVPSLAGSPSTSVSASPSPFSAQPAPLQPQYPAPAAQPPHASTVSPYMNLRYEYYNQFIPASQNASAEHPVVPPITKIALLDEQSSRPQSAPAGLLRPIPTYPNSSRPVLPSDYPANLRSLTRSPSLGYIPTAFPYDSSISTTSTDRNSNSAEIQPERSQSQAPALEPQVSPQLAYPDDHATPELAPSYTNSTLPSVPSLDLLSAFDDPASADALVVDSSHTGFAYLSQLLQEAEAAYTPLPSEKSQPSPAAILGARPSGDPSFPVAVPTSYERLISSSYRPATTLPPQFNINPSNVHTRADSGSSFNMSFAPSLQSHSTSVRVGTSSGGSVADQSALVPSMNSFSIPLYPQGQPHASIWTAQRLQAFTLGTRRIHAMDTPEKGGGSGSRDAEKSLSSDSSYASDDVSYSSQGIDTDLVLGDSARGTMRDPVGTIVGEGRPE
ncbi:hypothetical protein EIP91_010989 [Steccherinum ochraceum]|uniref:Uncharacterized protein n=1 Tax=Steccherinum ochraceum TaxID=92696 RepID=A0A4R0RIY7_9APHY|nr:hypothetical protein EIP91_010989 [Steccherinum ochraceum]